MADFQQAIKGRAQRRSGEQIEVVAEPSGKPEFRSVFGLLVHPFTHAHFTQDKVTAHDEDSWVSVQFAAGKLTRA